VKILNAIATVTAQSAYDLCFNRDVRSNPTYSLDDPNGVCRDIVRDETSGAAMQVTSAYQNLGIILTSGLDVNLLWRAALADLGMQRLPGALSVDMAVGLNWRHLPAVKNHNGTGPYTPPDKPVRAGSAPVR